MRPILMFLANAALLAAATVADADETNPTKLLQESKRVVFLGDSITAAGQYVAIFDTWIVAQRWKTSPQLINCGLPSETVSGLSEEGHAGGKFPPPDLAERLDRVLTLTKPDLVVACYGINCGIYQPFADERFQRYREGLERLKSQVEKFGAKLILITPPFYDDQRSPKPFSYNEVLDRYSDWLLEQRGKGWQIIDLHGPMTREVQERRKPDPQFTFQPDGVHPNEDGHWFIAQQVIRWFGDESVAAAKSPEDLLKAHALPAELLPLVKQRMSVLRDAYVAAAGHKRPGVATGLPVSEAEKKAAGFNTSIAELLTNGRR